MNTFLILLAFAIGIVVAFFVLRAISPKGSDEATRSALMMVQNQLNNLQQVIDVKMSESQKSIAESAKSANASMHAQLSESRKMVGDITERLTRLDETNKQVVGFAEGLQSLQDILKNPKQRGILGEYYLETVLKNVLPPGRYEMQYKFPNGDIVDAVIFLDKGKILPIDSKFSLENYNKILAETNPVEREKLEKLFKADVKTRIDETSKYILPKEGTMDFAFMFIPSEAIYYDLLINKVGAVTISTRDLIEYAFQQKRVIIVSPTSFMAYLQTVMQGLRALQIEESAKEIRKRVEDLGKHLANYDQFMLGLGEHLQRAMNKYNDSVKEFKKIDKDVVRIAGGESLGLTDKTVTGREEA